MTEYDANKGLKEGAANVRNPRARTRSTDSGAPVARMLFRGLLLAAWGVTVYNVALAVLS
jgi:hypothetical protein